MSFNQSIVEAAAFEWFLLRQGVRAKIKVMTSSLRQSQAQWEPHSRARWDG